jgi:hypothetical protein
MKINKKYEQMPLT